MAFEPGALAPKTEFGYWAGAVRRWLREGLPCREAVPDSALDGDTIRGSLPFGFESSLVSKSGTGELVDRNVMPALGLESHLAKFPLDFSPRLPRRVIEEDEHRRIFMDSYGITKMVTKHNAATWHSLDFPIKTRGTSATTSPATTGTTRPGSRPPSTNWQRRSQTGSTPSGWAGSPSGSPSSPAP